MRPKFQKTYSQSQDAKSSLADHWCIWKFIEVTLYATWYFFLSYSLFVNLIITLFTEGRIGWFVSESYWVLCLTVINWKSGKLPILVFRPIRGYWPEQFRPIRGYWPEQFRPITSSFQPTSWSLFSTHWSCTEFDFFMYFIWIQLFTHFFWYDSKQI